MDEFFEISSIGVSEPSMTILNDNEEIEEYRPKVDLYMYFTTAVHCNEYKSHRPLNIIEKMGNFF